MNSKWIFVFLLCFHAVSAQNGEEIFQFMNLPISARQAALGGTANASWDSDANMTLANPALVNEKMHNQFGINYTTYLDDISYGTVSYVRQLNDEKSYVSIGGRFVDYGTFKQSDNIGNETGTFQVKDAAITLGYGYNIGDFFTLGTNVSYVTSTIETYQSQAILADFGVVFHDIDYNNNLSLVFKNVGFQFDPYNEEQEKLPFQLNLGFSTRPEFIPVELSVTMSNIQNWNLSDPTNANGDKTGLGKELLDHLAVGAEFFPEKGFNLRLGYNFKRGSEMSVENARSFAGLNFGIGFRISYFRFDYTHSRYHNSGNVNTFGLKINLEEMLGKRYSWE